MLPMTSYLSDLYCLFQKDMDSWPRRAKKEKKILQESEHRSILVPKSYTTSSGYGVVDTLGEQKKPTVSDANSLLATSALSGSRKVVSSSTSTIKRQKASLLSKPSTFLSNQVPINSIILIKKLDTSIRKVYHDPIQIDDSVPETTSNPFLRQPIASTIDITPDLPVEKPKQAPALPAKENFVRLDLKRRLNVKHRPHKRRFLQEDTPDVALEPTNDILPSAGITEEETIELATAASPEAPPSEVPLCHHGIPAVLRTVKKSGKNHGKEFYCCCHDRFSSCHFFMWRENNRADFVSFLNASNNETTPSKSKKELLLEFQKAQIEKLSTEELKGLMKQYSCLSKTNKKDMITALLDCSSTLFDQITELQQHPSLTESHLQSVLRSVFGIPKFRPNQVSVIQSVLHHENWLFISPTGSGKSLTYQLPSLLLPGVSLVVSPLISLMQDQHNHLPPLLSSLVLTGSLSPYFLNDAIKAINSGIIKIVYISPEKLFSPMFQRLLRLTSLANQIELIVVDEAHCISSWSFNFRADYLRLYSIISFIQKSKIGENFGKLCGVLALTGTGGVRVKEDICKQLRIPEDHVIDNGWFRRNIKIGSIFSPQPRSCQQQLLQFLQSSYFSSESRQNVIIFVPFRRDTLAVCDFLQSYNIDCTIYHGGLDGSQRKKSLRQFGQKGKSLHVIVATSAFGMGVDIKNIKSIIHLYGVRSIQSYIQEIGRYRGNDKDALAVSFMNDSTWIKLYSLAWSNYVSFSSVRSFILQTCTMIPFSCVRLLSNEQEFNLPMETMKTCLILLENEGFVHFEYEYLNHLVITPLNHEQLMVRDSFYASLFSFSTNYDKNTNTFDIDLFLFSEFYKKPLDSIRNSIRQLEIQHALVVKASELSALVNVIKIPTEQDIQEVFNHLATRQKEEVEEIKRIYYFLSCIRVEKTDLLSSSQENNELVEELLNLYFENNQFDVEIDSSPERFMSIRDYKNDQLQKVQWPIRCVDEQTKRGVIRSARMLLRDDRISKKNLEGMTFAKIWHEVATPVYPSDIWSTSEHWGLFSQYDIEELAAIAEEEIQLVLVGKFIVFSSSSESEDIIDDTGCEDRFKETYWDINYINSIAYDEVVEEEEDVPYAKVIRRFAYKELDTNGEEVRESFIPDESEDEYDYSEENSDSFDSEDEECCVTNNIQTEDQMNKSKDEDEFYDPDRDDKDAAWIEKHHGPSTDAVLCCPSCFTTICYNGKPVHKRSDRNKIVFMCDEVCNCLELINSGVKVNIKGEDGKFREAISYKVVCDVCENDLGFKREGKYYITDAIEENASICIVC